MVLKVEHERMKTLIARVVSVLCKNGLNYTKEFRIEGLLAVTLDQDDIFLLNINELVKHDSLNDSAERGRLRTLIANVVLVLCKNGLNYTKEFRIEGLLAVTLDKDDIFLVNINEFVKHDSFKGSSDNECEVVIGEDILSHSDSLRRKRKERCHKTGDCPPGGEAGDNSNDAVDFRVNNGEGPVKINITSEENERDSEEGLLAGLSIDDVSGLVGDHNRSTNNSLNFNPSQMNLPMLPAVQNNNSNIISEISQQ